MRKLLLTVLLTASVLFAQPELKRAEKLFQRTDYAGVLDLLKKVEPKTGAVHALMGKSEYMSGEFKRASDYFEKAIAADPGESEYYHWLGRAFGRRAETSSFVTAPGLASKARKSFEKAVELDPKNLEAVNDLFAYYLEAPGFLGGGIDKAAALSQRIRALDPVEYHYALAKIAENRKEFDKAEEHLRRATELAPRQIGRVLDLANFLSTHGKVQEGEELFVRAQQIAPQSPKVMFERASAYIRLKRNLDTARRLLQQYLKSDLTPDDPPREEAEKLLRRSYGS